MIYVDFRIVFARYWMSITGYKKLCVGKNIARSPCFILQKLFNLKHTTVTFNKRINGIFFHVNTCNPYEVYKKHLQTIKDI